MSPVKLNYVPVGVKSFQDLFTSISVVAASNATYYGKTKRHFKVRICEHLGISHLTERFGVKIHNNKLTAIQNTSYVATILPPLKNFPF